MDRVSKPDEFYMDGKDKWTVQYLFDEDTKVNPGDYNEIIKIMKNGQKVGQKTWRKDKNGNNKADPWEEGIQSVPAGAKRVKK